MACAGDCCAKALRCAELDGGIRRRDCDRDVARNGQLRRRRFRLVCAACCRHLDDRWRRQIARRGVNAARCDSSCGHASAWNAVHAPRNARGRAVCHRCRQRLRIPQQHQAARGRNRHADG